MRSIIDKSSPRLANEEEVHKDEGRICKCMFDCGPCPYLSKSSMDLSCNKSACTSKMNNFANIDIAYLKVDPSLFPSHMDQDHLLIY